MVTSGLSALQTCISFEFLEVWWLCPVSCSARIDYRRADSPRPVPVSICASIEHKPTPHPDEETLLHLPDPGPIKACG